MRAQFILSEIGLGLRRNLTLTISLVVTVAISLLLFGAGLLFRAQVNEMKTFWYDKIEVSVFLCGQDSDVPSCAQGEVNQVQRDQIRTDLQSLPQVEQVFYESKEQAYERFTKQFEGSAIVDNVSADALPESFRVKLKNPEDFAIVASAFVGRPGIEQVQDDREVLEKFFKALNWLQIFVFAVSAALLIAAVLQITNTIRVAAFSRRRETGIMKLVGASRFYIQLPFILESALAGLAGAVLAVVALAAGQKFLVEGVLVPNFPITNFIGWDDLWRTAPWLLLLGILMSALASFVTLQRYLRV